MEGARKMIVGGLGRGVVVVRFSLADGLEEWAEVIETDPIWPTYYWQQSRYNPGILLAASISLEVKGYLESRPLFSGPGCLEPWLRHKSDGVRDNCNRLLTRTGDLRDF